MSRRAQVHGGIKGITPGASPHSSMIHTQAGSLEEALSIIARDKRVKPRTKRQPPPVTLARFSWDRD